jgi:hypothetical protein
MLLCAVALLQTGAHMSQSFVNYPAWHLIDSGSFPAYHWAISIRAGLFLLVPRIVEIVIGLTVLRFRPEAIGRSVLLLGIGFALGALLSTVLIQRPIHRELDIQSNTPDLLSRLMVTDWIRNSLEFARVALYLGGLSKLIAPRARPEQERAVRA